MAQDVRVVNSGVRVVISVFRVVNSDVRVVDPDARVVSSDVRVAAADFRGVHACVRVVTSGFHVVNSDFRVVNSDVRVVNADVRVVNSDVRVVNSDVRVVNADFRVVNSHVLAVLSDVRAVTSEVRGVNSGSPGQITVQYWKTNSERRCWKEKCNLPIPSALSEPEPCEAEARGHFFLLAHGEPRREAASSPERLGRFCRFAPYNKRARRACSKISSMVAHFERSASFFCRFTAGAPNQSQTPYFIFSAGQV